MYNEDDLVFIVSAANIAGFLEMDEQSTASDDEDLKDFIVSAYIKWQAMGYDQPPWIDYITDALRAEYGTEG